MANKKLKKERILQHRKDQYLHALFELIDGKVPPEYVTERWDKLQQIIKGDKS